MTNMKHAYPMARIDDGRLLQDPARYLPGTLAI